MAEGAAISLILPAHARQSPTVKRPLLILVLLFALLGCAASNPPVEPWINDPARTAWVVTFDASYSQHIVELLETHGIPTCVDTTTGGGHLSVPREMAKRASDLVRSDIREYGYW